MSSKDLVWGIEDLFFKHQLSAPKCQCLCKRNKIMVVQNFELSSWLIDKRYGTRGGYFEFEKKEFLRMNAMDQVLPKRAVWVLMKGWLLERCGSVKLVFSRSSQAGK